jgi:hypothetical protein
MSKTSIACPQRVRIAAKYQGGIRRGPATATARRTRIWQRVQAADGNGGQVPAGGAELVELDEPVDGLARAGAGDVTRGTA